MYCSRCGLRITNERANFCKRCGNRLGQNRDVTFTSTNKDEDIFLRARKKLINFASPKIEKTRTYTANKLENLQKKIDLRFED